MSLKRFYQPTLLLIGLILSGCGPSIRPAGEPVEVKMKVTSNGFPVDNVSLTLQPTVAGAQAVSPVAKGEFSAMIVPGTYTYYVETGKTEADLAKIPTDCRTGSLERTIDLTNGGAYEIELK